MNILIFFLSLLIFFLCMEGVTWFTHKYIMHGLLWYLHKDHHRPTPGFFEKNDWFFVIFAIPSMVLLYMGSARHNPILLGAGAGICCYGFAYFLVHDLIIHQRFKLFTRSKSPYIRTLRWAHKMHHKHIDHTPGESYGMLFVARKYWDKIRADDDKMKENKS